MAEKKLKVPDYLIERNRDLLQEMAVYIRKARLAEEAEKKAKGA